MISACYYGLKLTNDFVLRATRISQQVKNIKTNYYPYIPLYIQAIAYIIFPVKQSG